MDESHSPQVLLDLIAAHTTDTLILIDTHATMLFINRTVPGITVDEVVGTSLYAHLPPQSQDTVRATLERVRVTGAPHQYLTDYHGPAGEHSRWESRVSPTLVDGEVTGFVIVASNVTQRDAAALERDRLFELSLDMLCVIERGGTFKRVNPALLRILGYSEDEVLGKDVSLIVDPQDRERTAEAFRCMAAGEGDVSGLVTRCQHKNGEVRTFEWNATLDPATLDVIGTARDVTETHALQDQLRQAQKMDAVGQLAGGIAHDFNNLLQAILGNVQFARASVTGRETLEFLADIQAAAERAAQLTSKLLAFSRQQPVTFVSLDLETVVRELLALLSRVIPSTIELELIAGKGLEPISGDRSQIEQVVMNLCLNARDALSLGGRITIELTQQEFDGASRVAGAPAEPGRYVVLSVSDTGAGIDPALRERVFDPFFTTKPQGKGVGLGLSTVYGVVQQHAGRVHLEDSGESGTTFKVYLPVAAGETPEAPTSVSTSPSGEGELVVVAEDEDLVRGVVVKTLRRAGYRVAVAENGLEAVALCRELPSVRLALLDVVMPGLNGPDAARQLAEVCPDLPVLFCSAYNDPGQFSAELPPGATVIKKPYRAETLLAKIRAALSS